jgi:hypothetical protein
VTSGGRCKAPFYTAFLRYSVGFVVRTGEKMPEKLHQARDRLLVDMSDRRALEAVA